MPRVGSARGGLEHRSSSAPTCESVRLGSCGLDPWHANAAVQYEARLGNGGAREEGDVEGGRRQQVARESRAVRIEGDLPQRGQEWWANAEGPGMVSTLRGARDDEDSREGARDGEVRSEQHETE